MPSPSHVNPIACLKGFALVGLATERPRVMRLFISLLSRSPVGFYGLGTLSSCRHLSMQKRASERKDTVVPHMDSHAPLCQVSCITLSLNIDLYTFSFFFVFLSFFFPTRMPLLSPVNSWQLTPHPPHLKAFSIHSSLCLYSSHIYKLRAHNFSCTSKKGSE